MNLLPGCGPALRQNVIFSNGCESPQKVETTKKTTMARKLATKLNLGSGLCLDSSLVV